MSNKVSERVWALTKQEGSRLNVMLALAWFANDKGICFPGDEELAKRCRMKERNAQYILKDLEAQREIFKVRNPGRGLRSYTIVTVGWTARRVYRVLRCDFQMDRKAARAAVEAWLEKGANEREKVQSIEKVQPDVEKVQSSAEKAQAGVEKGANERPPYKEETSGKSHEPSRNPHTAAPPRARAEVRRVDCPGCRGKVPVRTSGGKEVAVCVSCKIDALAPPVKQTGPDAPDTLEAETAKCMGFYEKLYEEKFGRKPRVTKGKDFELMRGVVRQYGKRETQALIGMFIRSDDPKLRETGHTVPMFTARINPLLEARARVTRPQAQKGAAVGAPASNGAWRVIIDQNLTEEISECAGTEKAGELDKLRRELPTLTREEANRRWGQIESGQA